jgi:hypothetical protein
MRNRFYSVWLARALGITVALTLMMPVASGPSVVLGQVLPSDAQSTCIVTPQVFATWFESGTPSLNGVVNPANSVTFPNSPNCSFYQWSEQMFLWLTSPAPKSYGGGGGRIFDSPAFFDVSPPDQNGNRTFIPHESGKIRFFAVRAAKVGLHRLPVIMDKRGRMFEIERPKLAPSGKPLILSRLGKPIEIERIALEKGKPIFLDKAGKVIAKPKPIIQPELLKTKTLMVQKFMIGRKPIFLDPFGNVIDTEEGQADGGVLETQNGSLVYSAIMVNDVYAYFLTGTKNGGITPAPTKFPTTQADLNKITAFASAHGKTFPDPKALAIEVKTAWVEAAGLPNASSYITMQATVPTYDTSNPLLWTPNGQKTVQLALVGVHVVGSTAGHPEMIWATFEHFGNAPNAAYQYNSTSGTNPKTVPQSTAGTWLLTANNSAGPFNNVHMDAFSVPNIEADSANPPNPPPPFTISPSDTIRMKAFGGGFDFSPNPLDANTAASNTEIISINNSVLGQLVSGDTRANYYMTGSTWTIGGAGPTGPFKSGGGGGNEVGTSQLANTTMETYQQGPSNNRSAGVNCFACHGSNTTNVSHIFPVLQPLFP